MTSQWDLCLKFFMEVFNSFISIFDRPLFGLDNFLLYILAILLFGFLLSLAIKFR